MFEGAGLGKTLLIAGVCQICLYYAELYDLRIVSDRRELFVRIVQALGIGGVHPGRDLFLVSGSDHRPRRVHDCRGAGDGAGGRAGVSRSSGSAGMCGRANGCCWWARARRRWRWRARSSSAGRSSASRSSGSSTRIPPWWARRVINPGRHRHDRGHSLHRPRARRRPRRRQPCRCARQAADGQAARDEARRRVFRSSRFGVRGLHRQDRRREPAPELADLLGRIQEEPHAPRPSSVAWTSSSPSFGLVAADCR